MWDGPQSKLEGPPSYTIVLIEDDGAVAGVLRVDALNDDEAMAVAGNASRKHSIELWDGLRFIEHFRARAPV